MHFIDSHLHLSNSIEEMLAASSYTLVNAASEVEWGTILALSSETVTPFIGVHPWFIEQAELGWMERLEERLRSSDAGLGEVGLDKFRGPSLVEQETALRGQIDIAKTLERPVVLHCVKRWGALLDVLRHYAPLNRRFMVHGFNGSVDVMQELTGLGCQISVGLELLADNSRIKKVWQEAPDEYILLESDAPDGLQRSHLLQKGITYTGAMEALYVEASRLRGCSVDELVGLVEENLKHYLTMG